MKQKVTRSAKAPANTAQNGTPAAKTPAKPAAAATAATPVKAAAPAAAAAAATPAKKVAATAAAKKVVGKAATPVKAPVVVKPVEEKVVVVEEEEEVEDVDMDEFDQENGEEADVDMGDVEEAEAADAGNSTPPEIVKIRNGPVPKDMPDEQVILVKNLPRKLKQVKLVEVFGQYGNIVAIQNIPNQDQESSSAYIAYEKADDATAALAANSTAQIMGKPLQVTLRKTPAKKLKKQEERQKMIEERQKQYEERKKKIEEGKMRTVYVRNLKNGTTEEQITQHFASFGEIEDVTVVVKRAAYAFVTFTQEEAAKAALKQHNSVLNDVVIGVFMRSDENEHQFVKDPARTVLIKNNQKFENIEVEKLNKIFEPCGEIENIEILCKRVVLAFVTFKDEESAKEALKLNGQNIEGLDLEIDEYKLTNRPRNTVFIQNVRQPVTEDHIRDLFTDTGAIESIVLKPGYALVRFVESDGFCKAFLLNEHYLCGHMIFLEPYSDKKQTVLKSRKPHHPSYHGGKKRTMSYNKGVSPKKFKQI